MRYIRFKETKATLTLKILTSVVFLWSCFFWSGVTILNFYIIMPEYSYIATNFLIGTILITVSVIIMYFRCYILQFPVCAVGSWIYLSAAGELIDTAAKTDTVFKPSFELRYLPEIAIILFSLSLAMIHAFSVYTERAQERERYNNSPAKSILDDK